MAASWTRQSEARATDARTPGCLRRQSAGSPDCSFGSACAGRGTSPRPAALRAPALPAVNVLACSGDAYTEWDNLGTARAIDLAIGERSDGPVFLAPDGRRLDRHGAGRTVRRIARRAGITKPVGPHTLRHAFITAALDAGVPLRDVQEAASHADPRTTMRYDRARTSLDRHTTYIVAAYVAGAAR